MSFLNKIKSWFGGGSSAPAVSEPPAKKKTAAAKPAAEAKPVAEAEEPKPPDAAEQANRNHFFVPYSLTLALTHACVCGQRFCLSKAGYSM